MSSQRSRLTNQTLLNNILCVLGGILERQILLVGYFKHRKWVRDIIEHFSVLTKVHRDRSSDIFCLFYFLKDDL